MITLANRTARILPTGPKIVHLCNYLGFISPTGFYTPCGRLEHYRTAQFMVQKLCQGIERLEDPVRILIDIGYIQIALCGATSEILAYAKAQVTKSALDRFYGLGVEAASMGDHAYAAQIHEQWKDLQSDPKGRTPWL